MKILINKIASVLKNVGLADEVELTDQIVSEDGAVLVAKVLEDKKIYNLLELTSGRLSTLHKGDIIAVALGNRKALKGFVGEVPKSLKVGSIINVLNLGGVAGICTSENIKEVGHALKIEVIGAVTDGEKNLNINQFKLFSATSDLVKSAPLIVVSGTCMNVGKTSVACEMIKNAKRKNLRIFGAKLAGVAALRDTENMKDFGVEKAVSFIDAGLSSTVGKDETVVNVAKGAIAYLSDGNPDFIVIEFGDGVYGEYGVMSILKDRQISSNIIAHIGCAHDPVGAVKLVEICQEIGIPVDAISGPVTDNEVGTSFVVEKTGTQAFNALTQGKKLFDYLNEKCLKK